jgi:AP-3 complex subunit sigma
VLLIRWSSFRLSKFYNKRIDGKALTEHLQQQVITDVFQSISRRGANVCNFVEFPGSNGWGQGSKIVYRNFATLFFICVADSSESELGVLELIHILVETLDKAFTEVCELDVVFNWDKINFIVDEIVTGGLVSETLTHEILLNLKEQKALEKATTPAANITRK